VSTFKYDTAAVAFGTKEIDWLTDDIRAMLVGPGYSVLRATDQFVSIIPPAQIIVRSDQMISMAITNGVYTGLIPQFLALASETIVAALVIYKNNAGDDTTSQLIYYSDDGIGFPFLPAGVNYFVTYDQANGGWFQ